MWLFHSVVFISFYQKDYSFPLISYFLLYPFLFHLRKTLWSYDRTQVSCLPHLIKWDEWRCHASEDWAWLSGRWRREVLRKASLGKGLSLHPQPCHCPWARAHHSDPKLKEDQRWPSHGQEVTHCVERFTKQTLQTKHGSGWSTTVLQYFSESRTFSGWQGSLYFLLVVLRWVYQRAQMWGEHHRSVLLLRLCKEQYAYCQVICLWIPVHSPCEAYREAWTMWGGWKLDTFPEDFWMALHDWAYCLVKFQPGDELSRGGTKRYLWSIFGGAEGY